MVIEPAWLQASSTVVLVLVTGYYTYLLHRQNNRERRSYHTDTLRERVREWYEHLPEMHLTEVESAEPTYVLGESDEFRVAPQRLEDDNYFQDLLENHAVELRQHKTRIEELHGQFAALKEDFVQEFDDTGPIESAPLDLEATSRYPDWVFDRALILERTERTNEDLYKMAEQALERNTSADNEETQYPSNAGNSYSIIVTRPRDDSVEDDKEIVANALKEAIDRVDEYEDYEIAAEAASILNEIESEIEALEKKLVEYEGMATYPGDCKYIK